MKKIVISLFIIIASSLILGCQPSVDIKTPEDTSIIQGISNKQYNLLYFYTDT